MTTDNIVMFYPEDWMVLQGDARMESLPLRDAAYRCELTMQSVLCPRSLYESRHHDNGRFAAFMRTGEIPDDCPELRRIASIRNVTP